MHWKRGQELHLRRLGYEPSVRLSELPRDNGVPGPRVERGSNGSSDRS